MMERKLKDNPQQFLNIYSREAKVFDINKEERTAELVVATEQPVVVFDWFKWEPIREIVLVEGLRHSDSVIMLDTHSRWSTNDIKGSIRDFELKKNYENLGTVKIGTAHFSKTAEKEWTLRQEGHLTDSSIGYRVNDKETVVISAGSTQNIQGKEYKNDYADGLPLVIRTGADLLEVSLVPIGADQAAKFRSMFTPGTSIPASKDADSVSLTKDEVRTIIKEEMTEHENKIQSNKKGENKMEEIKVDESTKVAEEQRVASIDALAVKYEAKVPGLKERAELYKSTGKSFESFGELVTTEVEKSYKESAAKPNVDLSAKQKKEYSLARAIKSLFTKQNSMEIEISQEYARISGLDTNGFFMPHSVAAKGLRKTMKRDVNTTATTGGDFVGTDHLGGEWIDALLAKTVLAEAGVIYMPGRKGNIEIPKLTTGNTFGWAATENAATSESSPVTTEVTLSPKRGGTFVDVSKQAIIQSDPALDVVLTNNGQAVMVRGFEAGAFHGSGSSGQFKGIEKLTSVNNDTFGSADWQAILDAIKRIKTDKADIGELVWVTNATGEAILRGRTKESGYPVYLLGDDDRLAGRRTLITEAISANYMFLGSFNQAYMAFWDALDVTIDPYQFAQYGLVRITFNQLADFAVRHDEAFFYASDLS